MASFKSIAATEESTPPLRPNTTRSEPSLLRKSAMDVSTNDAGVQLELQWQISMTKFESNVAPSNECVTSG